MRLSFTAEMIRFSYHSKPLLVFSFPLWVHIKLLKTHPIFISMNSAAQAIRFTFFVSERGFDWEWHFYLRVFYKFLNKVSKAHWFPKIHKRLFFSYDFTGFCPSRRFWRNLPFHIGQVTCFGNRPNLSNRLSFYHWFPWENWTEEWVLIFMLFFQGYFRLP